MNEPMQPQLSSIITPGQKKRIGRLMIHFSKLDIEIQKNLLMNLSKFLNNIKGIEAVAFSEDLLEETIQ